MQTDRLVPKLWTIRVTIAVTGSRSVHENASAGDPANVSPRTNITVTEVRYDFCHRDRVRQSIQYISELDEIVGNEHPTHIGVRSFGTIL